MIDHFGINVSNLEQSKAFYQAVLAPLAGGLQHDFDVTVCFGKNDGTGSSLWLVEKEPAPIHIAFKAPSQTAVDAFYQAALAAGGTDNGAPGLRPQYHPNYYGAFVYDLDGYNIEAVYHGD